MSGSIKQSDFHLNGKHAGAFNTKNPPSAHAMNVLSEVHREPFPVQEMNFTVKNKLMAFGYIRLEDRPSPYKSHKSGSTVKFAVITDKGLSAI